MPTLDLPPDQSDGGTIFASLVNRIRAAIISVNSAVDTATSNISALTSTVSGKADASHTHAASAITSGLMSPARLGSGTASSSTFLTGAQTYATPVAANGIPAGGTTGQTLQKTSGTDYATGWATVTSSGTVSDASTTTKGIVILAGDLSGTASSPTVPGLANKAALSHTHAASDVTSGTLATARLASSGTASSSTFLRGDQTWAAPTATVADASTTSKGAVRLAGDLSGTASSPTVPGLAAKAPIASPTFTGTVSGVTKSMVGLSAVDNTADTDKPVSAATATALSGKAATSHTHAISDVSDLQSQLNQKAPTTRGLPSGGTSGQVLAKASSTAYDVGWVTPAAGTGSGSAGTTVTVETDAARPNVTLLRISDGTSSGTLAGPPGQPTITAA